MSSKRRRIQPGVALLPVAWYPLCVVGLVYLRFLPPVVTGVQAQRIVERTLAGEPPVRTMQWRPMERISPHLPHAVAAAEDARFYCHDGFDWEEVRAAREEARRGGEPMRRSSRRRSVAAPATWDGARRSSMAGCASRGGDRAVPLGSSSRQNVRTIE